MLGQVPALQDAITRGVWNLHPAPSGTLPWQVCELSVRLALETMPTQQQASVPGLWGPGCSRVSWYLLAFPRGPLVLSDGRREHG